jgi:hypothetical protein
VTARATTTLILALAAGLAAGCGGGDDEGGDPIPAEQAGALERQLESIQNRFEFGGSACTDITDGTDPNTVPVRSAIESLPQGVDPEVRQELERGFERLFELVQAQCEEDQPAEEQAPVDTGPTVPPEEDDDEGDDDEEAAPPVETGPTVTEPPVEVPPEGPTGTTGQGGLGQSGEGGSGTASEGGDGGAIAPGEVP